MTIDELAALEGTTTPRIRFLQTLDLLPRPELRGRTGRYGPEHATGSPPSSVCRSSASPSSRSVSLFRALQAGETLADVLGLPEPAPAVGHPGAEAAADTAELYGFAELQPAAARRGRDGALLSVVPTTVWGEGEAS